MGKDFKRPPFELDRTRGGTLVEQLAAALRRAIETGYYRAGDMLPPTRDLASLLGVSRVVAIRAVRRLADMRLVSQRSHTGSIVCAKDRPLWKGQVLIVVPPGGGNTADNVAAAVLRDALTVNGYLALAVTVPRKADGAFDFALLDLMTRQQTNLVVLLHDKPGIARWISARRLPFVWVTKTASARLSRGCVGIVRYSVSAAIDGFTAHCRERGVRRVTFVAAREFAEMGASLRAAGIAMGSWTIDAPSGTNGAQLSQMAMDFMSRRLSRCRKKLPGLIFFADDYVASGALVAMLLGGVRIPEETKVATWANRTNGSGLAFPVPLTRMEMDTLEWGRVIADGVLRYFEDGTFPPGISVGPTYIRGGTF